MISWAALSMLLIVGEFLYQKNLDLVLHPLMPVLEALNLAALNLDLDP